MSKCETLSGKLINMNELTENKGYKELIENIGSVFNKAKSKIISTINVEMLDAYWKIGKNIVEFEQKGKLKPDMERNY